MNILASADIHGNHRFYRWILDSAERCEAQAIVLAGDLLGYPPGFGSIEDAQRADAKAILTLLESSPVPVFFIMGNDDSVEIEAGSGPVRSVHGTRIELGRYNFVGYQFSLPFMAGVYEKSEEDIARDLEVLAPLIDELTVFVTHCPANGILDRTMLGTHAGSSSIRDLAKRKDFCAHIHGHIHSGFGREGRHFNVAALPTGRAMWIDVSQMIHRVLEFPAG